MLLCAWEIVCALAYAGSRGLLGRSILKNLKESTLLTFFDVATSFGLVSGVHYTYNEQKGTITFYNGSVIYLKDLFAYPSDPNFDSLGSTEFTYAGIDEANQVTAKAKAVVKTRLRYRLDDFGLIPKLFLSCNPAKNWVYSDFYLPSKRGTLASGRAFVQSLVTDNPHISPAYVEELRTTPDRALKERLLFGNWEYDDDPNALFDMESLTDMFSNPVARTGEKCIVCDVARLGRDKTIYSIWDGLVEIERIRLAKTLTTEIVGDLEGLRTKHGIPTSRVLVDEGGVGGGVVDQGGYKGFVSGAAPLQRPEDARRTFKVNYSNLRSQCAYTLAEYVRTNRIRIECDDGDVRQAIVGDLEQIKSKDPDRDNRLKIVGKDEMKEHLGRSPDDGDVVMMRMYFELQPARPGFLVMEV